MRQLHCLIAQVLVFSQVVDPFALAPPGEAGECGRRVPGTYFALISARRVQQPGLHEDPVIP
jgi:hypothetical protein